MKSKEAKHPNRAKLPDLVQKKVVDAEEDLFRHLRKGRIYKMMVGSYFYHQFHYPEAVWLYKEPFISHEGRINTLES